jgi:maltoporin
MRFAGYGSRRLPSGATCVLLVTLASPALAQPDPDPPPPAPDGPPAEPPKSEPAPVTAPPAPATPPVVTEPAMARLPVVDTYTGFRFGSYGRVIAGTDLRGGKPESANIVAHGPRVVEPSYLELDVSYGFRTERGVLLRPVITLAFDGTLFHDTGDFDAHPALRNMYLEALPSRNLTLWVGSRMYRGDDIYLFDYWPLDDLNTVGGGVMYHVGTSVPSSSADVAAHVGFNRLDNPFTFQQVAVPNPEQGATTVDQLDRERVIASATAAYTIGDLGDLATHAGLKIKVHGEFHALPSGTRRRINADGSLGPDTETLPSDTGVLVGAELSLFSWHASKVRRHLNLYTRYAQGLAAFDELAPPTSFGTDLKTQHANELTFGMAGNWDWHAGNVMIGALSRRFIDASGNDIDFNNGWEYAVDARPLLRVLPDTYAGVDLSYQARFPRGLNPYTEKAEDPAVFQIAPMLVYSPIGPSGYDRPQLRLVFDAARLNQGARDLYVVEDERHAHTWTYFLGFQCEWWFNSSTYQH